MSVLSVPGFFALVVAAGSSAAPVGKDFYANYSNANMFVGGYEDRVGWIIATATIGDFHIGVFLTSFLISFSVLNMIVHFTELTLKKIHFL